MYRKMSLSWAAAAALALVFCVHSLVGQIGAQQGVQGQRVDSPRSGPTVIGAVNEPEPPVPEIYGVKMVGGGVYTIDYPRPLEQAAILLERKLGVPIWYEDPPWAFSGDLVEAADLPGNQELAARYPSWRGPLVPRGGRMTLTLPETPAALRAANPINLLETAIVAHGQLNNSSSFKVVRFGDTEFSIVATRAATKEGRAQTQVSPLDRKISFAEADRTLADTLNFICKAISVQLMVQFTGGPEKSRRVRIGANDEPARDVLARTMRMPGGTKIAWVLDYMPDLQLYTLGLRAVQIEARTPAGGTELRTLFWPKP
jgi:hypothetical protein